MYQNRESATHKASTEDDHPVFTLKVGAKVCVRNRFLGDWTTGFKVVEVLHEGYRIRRLSDGQDFPDVFAFEDVRLERRQHPLREIGGSHLDRGH